MRHHKNENEVKEACSFPMKDRRREELWKILIRRGDHEHNVKTLRENKDDLILVRQRGAGKKQDYVPCLYCKGYFTATYMVQHEKRCFNKKTEGRDRKYSLKTSRAALAAEICNGKYQDVHTIILAPMRSCKEKIVIRNNDLLLLFGYVMMQSCDIGRVHDIRYGLKFLARVMIKLQKIPGKENSKAIDLLLPENFDNVLQVAKDITGYKGPRDIAKPNVFTLISYRLKNLCMCARGKALKEGSDFLIEQLRLFLQLYETEWKLHSNNAKASYDERKLNIPEKLPNKEDIKLLRKYCIQEIHGLCSKYSTGSFTAADYRQLARLCLARGLTFNARRGGEISKLTLQQWVGVEDGRWKKSSEIKNLADHVEKMLAERLQLCYVPGKKKKGKSGLVPILFTEEFTLAIRILVKERDLAGINKEQKYIFTTSGDSRLKGWDTLQAVTKQIVGLVAPELLTPTRTRKFLSTLLQLLDMSDGELTWVTNHIGHTKDTHFAWYRKESSTIELTKMARILTAVDEGKNIKKRKIDDLMNRSDTVRDTLET